MPQPLNRVIRNGEFRPNESVLNDNPELAKLVASIFGLWATLAEPPVNQRGRRRC